MPSGSHGGSGGSHSSGGSNFGGGSSFGGGSHSGHNGSYVSEYRPRPMNIWFFGRHYYVPASDSSKVGRFKPFAILSIIALIFMSIFLVSTNKAIKKIEVDRVYYINMIENAERDGDFKKQGEITDIYYNESCDRWYFTYYILTDNGQRLNGYTYSVYTQEEIRQYHVGDILDFAVNSKIVTLNTDSINMGYKDIPIGNDGEYIQNQKTKKGLIIGISIAVGIILLVVVVTILEAKKYAKEAATIDADAKKLEDGEIYCKYCGSIIPKNTLDCKNCGASRRDF